MYSGLVHLLSLLADRRHNDKLRIVIDHSKLAPESSATDRSRNRSPDMERGKFYRLCIDNSQNTGQDTRNRINEKEFFQEF